MFQNYESSVSCGVIRDIILTASRKQYQNKPRSSDLSPLSSLNTIAFIPSGANTQKIKRIDHSKCNVRASKNAGQAFSTQ